MALFLLVLLAACDPAAPPASATVAGGTQAEDNAENKAELLLDIEHLGGQAAAMPAGGRKDAARHDWERAYGIWQRHLSGTLRATDATGALELEYTFGQLRQEVVQNRGRPKPVAARLEQMLEARKAALLATVPAPPAPPAAAP